MTDPIKRIQELQRIIRSSNDHEALAELLILRSRVEGEQVYLEALQDRLLWNLYPASIKDKAIELVAGALAPSFQWACTREYKCRSLVHSIASFEHLASGALLNLIPGGTYLMGTDDIDSELFFCQSYNRGWDKEWITCETPAHRVTVEPFLMGHFLVTRKQWDRIGGYDERAMGGIDLPVDGICREDCLAWFDKAGGQLRLPSEAEWEYACRAGSPRRFFWGEDMNPDYCWHGSNSGRKSHALAEHAERYNAFGLVDMLGNLSEFCEDLWIDGYEAEAGGDFDHVVRGGSWDDHAPYCRCAARAPVYVARRGHFNGLRLAKSLPPHLFH